MGSWHHKFLLTMGSSVAGSGPPHEVHSVVRWKLVGQYHGRLRTRCLTRGRSYHSTAKATRESQELTERLQRQGTCQQVGQGAHGVAAWPQAERHGRLSVQRWSWTCAGTHHCVLSPVHKVGALLWCVGHVWRHSCACTPGPVQPAEP